MGANTEKKWVMVRDTKLPQDFYQRIIQPMGQFRVGFSFFGFGDAILGRMDPPTPEGVEFEIEQNHWVREMGWNRVECRNFSKEDKTYFDTYEGHNSDQKFKGYSLKKRRVAKKLDAMQSRQ